MPVGFPAFREALRAGTEIFHALRAILKKRGLATGVGDEGGFAPNLKGNQDALDVVMEAIGKAGFRAGENVYLALDCAASEFGNAAGRYEFHKSGEPGRDSEGMVALYEDWCRQYPILSIEDGCAEGDWRGWKLLTQALGRTDPAGRRRRLRHQPGDPGPRHRRGRRQRAAGEAQPDRHGDRDPRRHRDGHEGRLPQRRSRTAPARPRTRPSPTWRSARRRARSRPARRRAATASPSTTSCCASRKRSATAPSMPAAPPSRSSAEIRMYRVVLLRHGEIDLEPREPLHRLGRRRSEREGPGRGAERRPAAEGRRLHLRRRLLVAAEARDPDAVDRAGRARPAVDSGASLVAAQRTALRRPAGAQQGRDGGEARRGPGQDLAAQLRHPAAAADAPTTRSSRAATRAMPISHRPTCR